MKRTKFSEAKIAFVLERADDGRLGVRFATRLGSARQRTTPMDGSPGASDLISVPANLGANIYPASLARPTKWGIRVT